MGPGASIILKKNVFGQLCVKHSGADSIVDKSSGFCQFQIRTNIFFLEYIEANVSAVCPNSWNRKTVRFFWGFRCRHWPFWLCTIFSLVLIADAYLTIFIMYNVQCTTNNILSYEPIWYFVALSVLSSVGFSFILEF